jgi:phospholipid/cholesterol/gamma-HCH transport system substrate-binding protein
MVFTARQKTDFAVGVFLVVAAVGVVFIALRAANIAEFAVGDEYPLRLQFDNVGGLIERAPVKSGGVRVGRVKSISYDRDEHFAVVDILIDERFSFPADSIFSIVSSNLLGGQYVAINVGGDDEMLAKNDVIQGESAIVLEDLISRFLFNEAGK